MGKLNTNYSSYCYNSGARLNRTMAKYWNQCGTQNDCSGSSSGGESNSGDEASLEFGRIICCRGMRPMKCPERPVTEGGTALLSSSYESGKDELVDEGHVVELIHESRLAYRAEGNANIVLSLMDDHRVLRLRKATISCRDGKDPTIDLQGLTKYFRVIASCFSRRYVPEPKLGRLGTYDLEAFNKKLTKYRPVTRLDKEIHECDGILYPDVAFLPIKLDPVTFLHQDFGQDTTTRGYWYNTYCVEIKPKQGWSFHDECYEDGFTRRELFSNCDSAELAGTEIGKCRFCLYQYLKLQKKSIGKVSKYCPLDLFSGKPIRMLHAVKGLIGAPQNNFRLSKNGRIVYDEKQEKSVFNRILKELFPRDGRTKEERKTIFMNLIKEILLKDFSTYEAHRDRKLLTIRKDRKKKDKNQIHERTCSPINYQFLPKSCALKQVLDTQLLAKSNLTKVRPDLHRQGSSSSPGPFAFIDELYEKYLDCLEDYCGNQVSRTASDRSNYFIESYLDEQEKYQLGATALDCSIMITFRRLAEREEERLPSAARSHIVTIEAMKFLVNVTITDLDPKSLNHHKKYLQQLQNSVGAYREFMSKIRR
ncbi:inositol-pentakisphosphate 2-kinase-like [Ochlerotatus camptorhynchus]|uniref:inositol-pentakisphosphate 2-kinase-like n=1 Tax=Ochlerotatus camptorhynchus TaxID=644619 RepID=UPI0031D0E6F8